MPQESQQDKGPVRIVIADDHSLVRNGLRRILEQETDFRVIGEASDGDACLERVKNFRPDVLILDVSMPGGGPDLAKAAKELNPGMHIVVFSGRQENTTATAMLEAGADQYVLKTGRVRPLVQALENAYRPLAVDE